MDRLTDTSLRIDLDALAELARRLREQRTLNITNHNMVRAYLDGMSGLHHTVADMLDSIIDTARRAALPSEKTEPVAWRTDWQNAPRDGTPVRLRRPSHTEETTLAWSTHYSIHGLGGCWSDGFCTMSDLDFDGWLPASPSPAGMKVTDAMVEAASREFLLHRGFEPSKIKRSGMALWEENAPAMRAALTAALDQGEPK